MIESEAYKKYTSRQAWRDFGLRYPYDGCGAGITY